MYWITCLDCWIHKITNNNMGSFRAKCLTKVKLGISKETLGAWCLIPLTFSKFPNKRICLNGYHYSWKLLHWGRNVTLLPIGQTIKLHFLSSEAFKQKNNNKKINVMSLLDWKPARTIRAKDRKKKAPHFGSY